MTNLSDSSLVNNTFLSQQQIKLTKTLDQFKTVKVNGILDFFFLNIGIFSESLA